MVFLTLAICALVGVAAYNLVCGFINIPTAKTSRMMLLSKKQVGTKGEKMYEVYITRIAEFLARWVKLDTLRRAKLAAALQISGIRHTPEVYITKAFVTAGAVGLLAIPFGIVHPLFSLILLGLAVTVWFATYYKVFDDVKKRKKVIEYEIPRFAMTIAQSLEHNRDVLKILSSYRRVAGKDLGTELDATIAEMKTGNYEQALLHLETRVGSTIMSDLIRGLIGTLRGDDQTVYFKMLVFDMRQIEQSNLKKEVSKRPAKIQKYSMLMLLCIIFMYLVVLSFEVMQSLGAFFG